MSLYTGTVIQGHQVASGKAKHPHCASGTIEAQKPHFKKLGLALDTFFNGTLNVSFEPLMPKITQAAYTFKQVQWLPSQAAETFSFIPAEIHYRSKAYPSYVYYPHPETKPEHFQPPYVLEFIAPWIEHLSYGERLEIELPEDSIQMHPDSHGTA